MASKEEQIAYIDKLIEQKQLDAQLAGVDAAHDAQLMVGKIDALIQKKMQEKSEAQTKAVETGKPPSEDDMWDDTLDVAAEVAGGFNQPVIDLADMVTAPMRVTGEFITGKDVRAPSEILKEVGIGDVPYMEEGMARDVTRAVGTLGNFGAAMTPVTRASHTGKSIAADIFGAGSSTDDALAAMRTSAANIKNAVPTTDEGMAKEGIDFWKRRMIEKNRHLFDEQEAYNKKLAEAKKNGDGAAVIALEKEAPQMIHVPLREVQDYMDAVFDINDPQKVLDLIKKEKGLRFNKPGVKDTIDDLIDADHIFSNPQKALKKHFMSGAGEWLDNLIAPVTHVLAKRYDPRIANHAERAWEASMRSNATFMEQYFAPIKNVAKWVDDTPEAKALLLDMNEKPENLRVFARMLGSELGRDELRNFTRFWKFAESKNKQARQLLYKNEPDLDYDIHYIHTQKNAVDDETPAFASMKWNPPYSAQENLKTRSRKLTEEMDEDVFNAYQNPLLSHAKYVMDQETLLQMGKNFGMRPSMKSGSTSADFFKELSKRLQRDGMSKKRAEEVKGILNNTFEGGRRAPNQVIRAFMNTSYAGTLAQFKSAMLNLHDTAVAMYNIGTVPTLKALTQTMKSQFPKSVQRYIGSQQFGEFVREFDHFTSNPSALDKVSSMTKQFADGAMLVSGFKHMDEIGKGVVLRSAVNAARQSAKDGKFMSEWADFIIDKGDRMLVNKYLKEGVKPKDMPPRIRHLVEDMAFSKLGEQQLITAAGRPMAYLNNPNARFAYAMTGFAIKQQALLRKNIGGKLAKGDVKGAGADAARYFILAGGGYALIDSARSVAFKNEELEEQDIPHLMLDQMAAAATLNKLGDDYSRSMFWNNPVEFAMHSLAPPGGVLEKVFTGDALEAVPAFGDIYKYYLKDDDNAD